jgi:hypothetical protein
MLSYSAHTIPRKYDDLGGAGCERLLGISAGDALARLGWLIS